MKRLSLSKTAGALALAAGLACAPFAQAGNQKEEALADSVRLALSHAIRDERPPQPKFATPADLQRYQQWLAQMSQRLQRKLPDAQLRTEFLETVWYEARRAGLNRPWCWA